MGVLKGFGFRRGDKLWGKGLALYTETNSEAGRWKDNRGLQKSLFFMKADREKLFLEILTNTYGRDLGL